MNEQEQADRMNTPMNVLQVLLAACVILPIMLVESVREWWQSRKEPTT